MNVLDGAAVPNGLPRPGYESPRQRAGQDGASSQPDSSGKQQRDRIPSLSLDALVAIEQKALQEEDYQCAAHTPTATAALHGTRRQRLCEWLYNFVDFVNESRDVVHIAMSIYDRYFTTLHRKNLQLQRQRQPQRRPDKESHVALACLFLAVRIRGTVPLDLPRIFELCRPDVKIPQVIAIGSSLLGLLSWNHRFVVPREFIAEILKHTKPHIAPDSILRLWEDSSFFAEVAVMDSRLVGVPASRMAMACLYNAVEDLGLCHYTKSHFSSLLNELFDVDTDSPSFRCLAAKIKCAYLLTSECSHLVMDEDNDVISSADNRDAASTLGNRQSLSNLVVVAEDDDNDEPEQRRPQSPDRKRIAVSNVAPAAANTTRKRRRQD